VQVEDLEKAIDRFKGALSAEIRSNGSSGFAEDEYRELRAALKQHPSLQAHLPEWLRRGASLREAVARIRQEAGDDRGKWKRCDGIVSAGVDPLLAVLEGEDVVAAAYYEKLELLGAGGFGEVYRYRHKLLDRDFALKLLNPSAFVGQADHAVARFYKEARILFELRHPNIVRVYDVGKMGSRPFIRMELVTGESVRERIQRVGGLTIGDASAVACDLASALAHAHYDVGVIHRDIKSSNVMITEAASPILLDFGLGVFVQDEIASRLTRTGEAPAGGVYTAPELLNDPKLTDPRTDVYSLGVLWFEMLTGCPPAPSQAKEELDELYDLNIQERELLLACLAPLKKRPTSREVAKQLRSA
jgi:serine/threonine-protein kinase